MLVPAEVQRIANKYKYSARDINPKDRGHLLKYETVGDTGSSDNKVLVKNSIAYEHMMLHFLMCGYFRTYQCDLTSSSPLERW